VPPDPLQVSVKLVCEDSGGVVVVPLVGIAPLHPPDAVQALALVALHCSVADPPIATLLSLAFNVTNGGAATAGVCAALGVCVVCVVWASELVPQAESALSTTNPSIDFNANANPARCLRRIELIRVSQDGLQKIFRGARFHSSAIFEITYSLHISNPPTCRQLQTTYV
jgi:hypothetical protein